jgi:glyoxylase-like metal-dependent hydrolase (beta-lactamase superfamily II)
VGTSQCWSRRDFVGRSASCAAHIGLMSAFAPLGVRGLWAGQERFPVVASEPWGRIERIADGIWGLVSHPMVDRTTLCNGGIVAGRAGVVVIEAFGSEVGARWMAEQATRLAGRPPTHVVLTHYHGDHTGGLAGALSESEPEILTTAATRDLRRERGQGAAAELVARARVIDAGRPTEIDLGDRSLIVVPRRGHTDSDLTIEIPEQGVAFCGDLVWNQMFPNYVDATPSRLTQAVRLIRARGATTYVPGHGPLADDAALDRYLDLLDDVEGAARRALERGASAEEAGEAYRLPSGLEEWTLFNPGYFGRALGAWLAELGPER